jgi:hypothetical protein
VYFDEVYFDGRALAPSRFDICGAAENISLSFFGESAISAPITFSGATVLYSLLSEKR